MTDLRLAEAAAYIGVPPGVLHSWVWSRGMPTANGSLWAPTFRREELERFVRGIRPVINESMT